METAYLAGGCFWCVEAIFQRVRGVKEVESGYCNGTTPNPSYESICSGQTGHAEVLRIDFDENEVTFSELLKVFVETHDPTSLNQQGADRGTQYRSAIFYINDLQKQIATSVIENIKGAVTEITELDAFYPAEGYHQNYFNNNSNQPYCQMVILPKVTKYFK
ncbi:MAG: peptide-methionine (S)-S-oxide reductase [Thiotrichales bacterium]|jgi:peptide-methionine (S)-S-oxide reductase|nr:peptide-methionine (S)-S-oxide reductase [Thiotrichales bacterium]MDP6163942.1 peptide-methionine (S)-S-oxide reductase MsrA [Candidatus Thioglobus sp.]